MLQIQHSSRLRAFWEGPSDIYDISQNIISLHTAKDYCQYSLIFRHAYTAWACLQEKVECVASKRQEGTLAPTLILAPRVLCINIQLCKVLRFVVWAFRNMNFLFGHKYLVFVCIKKEKLDRTGRPVTGCNALLAASRIPWMRMFTRNAMQYTILQL